MGNNKIDGEERDNNFDISFDDELEGDFDALKVQGSGVKEVDPSSRKTMPDIDEIILKKEVELARAGHVDNAKDMDEDKGATGNDHSPENLSEMRLDNAIYAAMTIPPTRRDYDIVVEATRTEESLKAFITAGADLPHIMVEELTFREHLLLDEDFRAAGRVISLMEEAGIDTNSHISQLEKFAITRGESLSPGLICDLIMIYFKNLTGSMLVILEKSNIFGDESTEPEAQKLIPLESRAEMAKDKALVMTLRLVVKMGILYEMKHGDLETPIYYEFTKFIKQE